MAIEVQVEFIAKTTVRIIAYVYNDAGSLVAPSTSIKITITDPNGTIQVPGVVMTLVEAGIYEYYYKTTTATTKRWWHGEVVVIDGVAPDDKTSLGTFSFRIK